MKKKPGPIAHGGSSGPAKPKAKAKSKTAKPLSPKAYKAYKAYVAKHYPSSTKARAKTTSHARGFSLNGSRTGDAVKFGRNKPYTAVEKPRLVLDDYLDFGALPLPAALIDFSSEVTSWPMYGNDTIGDCTCATVGHEIQAWTKYAGTEVSVPEDAVIALYSAVTGYNPVTGANDNGANVQDILAYWRKTGCDGHKILAFAELKDFRDTQLRQCLEVFGTVYLGINCPDSALPQFNDGQPWTVVPGSQIDGGHAIPLQKWDVAAANPATVVTWAKAQECSWEFLKEYVEEAWVVITEDWVEKNGNSVSGFDLYELGEDMYGLTGTANPFPVPAGWNPGQKAPAAAVVAPEPAAAVSPHAAAPVIASFLRKFAEWIEEVL